MRGEMDLIRNYLKGRLTLQIASALLIFSVFFVNPPAHSREISPQRECAICHILWLEKFRQDGAAPLMVLPENTIMVADRRDVVSTERMCFTCHDGYVLDSRFAFDSERHRHPVYVKPSSKVTIPVRKEGSVIFPLNNGEIYCGTCHSAHGRSWDELSDKNKMIFLRETTENSAICVACHLGKATGPEEGNHPFFKEQRLAKIPTEEINELGGRVGTEKAQVICQSCHRVKGAPAEKLLLVKNENSELCSICHAAYYQHTRQEAAGKGTHPVNIKSDKINISEKAKELGTRTGSDGRIICQTCHIPHHAPSKSKILAVKDNSDSSLCRTCHADKGSVLITKHNMALAAPSEKNIKGVTAKEAGPCSACHVMHEGKGLKMWAKELKEGTDPMERLCLSCHNRDGVARTKPVGDFSHPVGRDIKNIGAETDLPLYTAEGMATGRKDTGNVVCATCHNPHQWDPVDPERRSLQDEEGDGSTSFLRKPVYVMSDLCIECHKDKVSVSGTKHDMLIMEKDSKNVWGRSASESGVCGSCHVPHNGEGPRMWARKLSAGNDPLERLCLSCHSENSIASKKTVGINSHPVGADIKKLGVKTPLPLFTKLGRRTGLKDEGNVSCPTCHDPHQWNRAKSEEKGGPGVEGTVENSFLRIASSGDSMLCGECHNDKITVRNTKHDLRFTGQGSKNILEETPSASGVCGGCHVPHNGTSIRMWARKDPGRKGDPVSSLCLTCHSNDGLAEKKQIGEVSHPLGVSLKNIDIIPGEEGWLSKFTEALKGPLAEPGIKKLPLFNEKGEKDEAGNLTCATCHNPHRWAADAGIDKSYTGTEGDGNTSFLRIKNAKDSGLCRNCHVDKRPVAFSKHNLGISAPGEKNSAGSTVDSSGVCSACHIPHNGEGPRLWAKQLEKGEYAAVKMCRSCHADEGVATNKVIGENSHPIGVRLKEVMSGNVLPLYDKEGKAGKDGVVVCLTCHNPHQWDPNDMNSTNGASKNAEGDGRNSFLRLTSAIEPVLCANCHDDKKWVIGTEHDLRVTAPNAENIKGQHIAESGICGQCHIVHNSPANTLLWGRSQGPGQNAMERLCKSCHSNDREASNKQPVRFNHPNVLMVSTDDVKRMEGKGDVNFPLYNAEGKRKNSGYITCPTCHNPHQWTAGKPKYGPGKNTEGQSTNSFLRNRSEFALCTDCHGMDGLFRYKYFHGETSRRTRPAFLPQ